MCYLCKRLEKASARHDRKQTFYLPTLPWFCQACALRSPWTKLDQTAHQEKAAPMHPQLEMIPASISHKENKKETKKILLPAMTYDFRSFL